MGLKLGYLLSGPLRTATPRNTTASILHVATQPTPDSDLQRFWSVESLGILPKHDSATTFLELYIMNNVERLVSHGRITTLPFLPNFLTCARRTRALARKRSPSLLSKYHEILSEQECRGFIE